MDNGRLPLFVSWAISGVGGIALLFFGIILNGLTSEINQLETTVQEHIGKHPHIEIKQDLAAVVVRAANNKQKVDKILESHLDQNAIDRLFKEFDEMGKILRRLDRDK